MPGKHFSTVYSHRIKRPYVRSFGQTHGVGKIMCALGGNKKADILCVLAGEEARFVARLSHMLTLINHMKMCLNNCFIVPRDIVGFITSAIQHIPPSMFAAFTFPIPQRHTALNTTLLSYGYYFTGFQFRYCGIRSARC